MAQKAHLIPMRRDLSHRHHFLSSKTGGQKDRFALAQLKMLGTQHLAPASRVLAALVCYEAILQPDDLASAYAALQGPVQWRAQVRIQWRTAEGNQDARFLCCVTLALASQVKTWPAFDAALRDLCQLLLVNGYGSEDPDPLLSFLKDATVWYRQCLPPALLGHIVGANRMAALPISCLAREASGLAVAPDLQPIEEEDSRDDEPSRRQKLYGLAFEAASLGRPGSMTGISFVDALIEAIRPPVSGSSVSKRLMVRQKLHGIGDRLVHADEASALLYAYALELTELGTPRKEKLAPTTPYVYLQAIGRDVQSALEGRLISKLEEAEYAIMLRDLLAKDPSSKPRQAALLGFHRFLQKWWDVPALPHTTLTGEEMTIIAANVVWPHEMSRIFSWLDAAPVSRLHDQVRLAFGIAGETMIRYSELIYLRCRNVIDQGGQIVIEIARSLKDGSEKSAAGRRRLQLSDKALCAQLRNWLLRRSAEGAIPGDYLFGDPNDARKIAHRGQMYYLMNSLLKAATGDPTVSLHTLRHTRGTDWMADALLADQQGEIRRPDVISVEAGHVGAHVTARFYAHLYEAALRKHVDDAFLPRLSSKQVAVLSGYSDDAVRQRFSRGRPAARISETESRANTIRQLIKHPLKAACVSQALRLHDPSSPISSEAEEKRCSLQTTLHILDDLSNGMPVSSVAVKQGVSPELVTACQAAVGTYAERFASIETGGITAAERGSRALRSRSSSLLGFKPDLRAALARVELSCIKDRAESAPEELLGHAIKYWRFSLTDGEVVLTQGDGLVRMAQFLHYCQLPAKRIGIRCSAENLDEPAKVVRVFEGILGIAPTRFSLQPRAGRPAITLVLGSSPERLRANGRGAYMAGFHSLMLAILVWRAICGAQE